MADTSEKLEKAIRLAAHEAFRADSSGYDHYQHHYYSMFMRSITEPDSDPDFNPGVFVPETKKRNTSASSSTRPRTKGKRKRSDALDNIPESEMAKKKAKTVDSAVLQRQNEFVKYFVDFDIASSSEAEDTEADADDEEDPDDEKEEEEEEEDTPSPIQPRSTLIPPYAPPPAAPSAPPSKVNEEDSVTESETEPEPDDAPKPPPRPVRRVFENGVLKRKSPPVPANLPVVKKARFAEPPEDDSVTESEESVTESEPDDDDTWRTAKTRPGFVRKPSQPILGPFILDQRKNIRVPGGINTFLREYQRDGIRFFYERYDKGRGGLLGDDMGLGKTIQVISFLSAIMRKHGDKRDIDRRKDYVSILQDGRNWKQHRKLPPANAKWPTCLIIAPSSVVHNWEREFETWGYFEVGIYTGPGRAEVLKDFKMGRLDVVVTSFETARADIALLDDLAWSCIIIDEFECVVRFGLSGTVIQNKYSEMWAILEWSYPGCVGSQKQWAGYVDKPLTKGQSKSASAEEHVRAALVARILRDKVLPNHFLRRTKSIIQDQLPEKIDEVVFCPLAPTQIAVYKRIINSAPVQNMIRKDEPCDCSSGKKELSEIAFGSKVPKYGTAVLNPNFCGKWLVLQSLLKEWRKDPTSKVLIFTKSVKLLEMLEFHLLSERMPMIDQFHADPNVFIFLISTLAGGTGLNLTGANKVVIFDPNWNPAHDLQAMDRAYRFGQTRDVSVYRLLGAGSLEELIYARQLYKQQQMAVGYNASLQTRYFEGVQGDKAKQGELFGIKNIFKLHEGNATQVTVRIMRTKLCGVVAFYFCCKRTVADQCRFAFTQIERATMTNLDWAFANMKSKAKPADLRLDADVKGAGKELGELKGLETLLFDDDAPPVEKASDIQKLLSDAGIGYTHRNDQLIRDNAIEELRMAALIEERKKTRQVQKKAAKAASSSKVTGKVGVPFFSPSSLSDRCFF
ncbi:hypothetical protein EUX98_g6002 [Antrodiella citrinella]|uniref:Helicase C-terminal domain-containing protein n=1 Tax=Antrodiella citrinella TaxID=2447956 RepID=A0A4S4MQ76_9APHY|nr:hypothetical protein EUX98_g6002 [Antrodiella citrinella]